MFVHRMVDVRLKPRGVGAASDRRQNGGREEKKGCGMEGRGVGGADVGWLRIVSLLRVSFFTSIGLSVSVFSLFLPFFTTYLLFTCLALVLSASVPPSLSLPHLTSPLLCLSASVIPSVSLSFHVSVPFFYSASFSHPNFLLHIPPSVCLSLSVSLPSSFCIRSPIHLPHQSILLYILISFSFCLFLFLCLWLC